MSFDTSILVTSRVLCKRERGFLLTFMIQVIEDGKDDPFHAVFIVEDPHGSGSSSDLSKGPLDEVGCAKLSPQSLLGFLKLLRTKAWFFLLREFCLIKTEQIIDLSLQAPDR
jgi:hypothetical protein